MAATTNSHGLTRNIPVDVKEEVRRLSKFGCVICRGAICDYEHILPEFKDATMHDPNCICLLCPSCHAKVTRRQISKRKVGRAYASVQENPRIRQPFSEFEFDHGNWSIDLGRSRFLVPKTVFSVDGIALLSFNSSPESYGAPELSGVFHDSKGRQLLNIDKNIWSAGTENIWDINIVGPKLTIRRDKGIVALQIVMQPPNGIRITQLDMQYGEARFYIPTDTNRAHLIVVERIVGGGKVSLAMCGDSTAAASCVAVDTTWPLPDAISLEIVGGQGVNLGGTGISWGLGSPSMHILEIAAWPLRPYL